MQFTSRAQLNDAVWDSLRNDTLKEFRRDLDRGLEACDRATSAASHFVGFYWAERERNRIFEMCGADLKIERICETEPNYRLKWAT